MSESPDTMSQEQETLPDDGRSESSPSPGDEAMVDDLRRQRRFATIEFVRQCLAGGTMIIALLMLAVSILMPVNLPNKADHQIYGFLYVFLVSMGITLLCVSGTGMLALRHAERYYSDEREVVRTTDTQVGRMAYLMFLASVLLPWLALLFAADASRGADTADTMATFVAIVFPAFTMMTFCVALPMLVLRNVVKPYADWRRLSERVFLGLARGWTVFVPWALIWLGVLQQAADAAWFDWAVVGTLVTLVVLAWFAWTLSALLRTARTDDPVSLVAADLYAKRPRPRISKLLGVVMTLGILVMAGVGLAGIRDMLSSPTDFHPVLALAPALLCVWNFVSYRRLSSNEEDVPGVLAGQVCSWRTYESFRRLSAAETIGLVMIPTSVTSHLGVGFLLIWPLVLVPLDLIVSADDGRIQDLSDARLVWRALWRSFVRWVGMSMVWSVVQYCFYML